ncbi:unnamed protein product [Eruca vesicaria subsp. sativa]|uniref:LIM zinc-binding domain-containing protein n=1 Tax=Eruca vesicaria subsp. sativa TaxID=29727 RepID=A0ABC8JPD3_ERUVS|nr:unnamed protein product [Eruca vesicaria subsp. sativa]
MGGEVRRRKINLTSTTDQVHVFVLVCSELESQKRMSFTQQKWRVCEKTVYAMELLSADGVPFQKSCFKCSHCKSTLQATQLRLIYSSTNGERSKNVGKGC